MGRGWMPSVGDTVLEEQPTNEPSARTAGALRSRSCCSPSPWASLSPALAQERWTVDDVIGDYERRPVENDWHAGRIERTSTGLLRWTNTAGRSWLLQTDLDGASPKLLTGDDNPYAGNDSPLSAPIWSGRHARMTHGGARVGVQFELAEGDSGSPTDIEPGARVYLKLASTDDVADGYPATHRYLFVGHQANIFCGEKTERVATWTLSILGELPAGGITTNAWFDLTNVAEKLPLRSEADDWVKGGTGYGYLQWRSSP